MPRKDVGDLQDVNIGGAARGVNTFVYSPRTARSNSALKLSEALTEAAERYQDIKDLDRQLDVKQATQDKLYGGTLFTNTVGEATADYETIKDRFKTTDELEAYYLQKTTPEEGFDNPHTEAGFREAQAKALGKLKGTHAEYLHKRNREIITRDALNDFFLTTKTDGADSAFSRLRTIADNLDISKEEMDKIPLGAAEVLIAQGKFKEAGDILTDKRGGAGSLLDRPSSAVKAHQLFSKVQTEDTLTIANQIKELEDVTEQGEPYTPAQLSILDNLLEDKSITVEKHVNLRQKNEEAVRVSQLSDGVAENLSTPGRTFFDPIPGAKTSEEAEKARKKFVSKFYDEAELKRSQGSIEPLDYAKRITAFSEKTNTTNPSVKSRLGGGYSAFSPQDIVSKGEVDMQTVSSIAEYMTLYKQNPQVAAAHVSGADAQEFFDAITMDVELGGLPGDTSEKIERAIKNYANDSLNPLKGTSQVRISDEDIISEFTNITDKEAGVSFFGIGGNNTGAATNAAQWVPYIKKQVQNSMRRTSGQDKTEAIEHVIKQIVKRSQRIGDYLVPKGTNTYIGNQEDIEAINNAAVSAYIQANPEDGYEEDELVLVPMIGTKDTWGLTVKGSNQVLEIYPHKDLPLVGKPKTVQGEQSQEEIKGSVGDDMLQEDKKLLDFIAQPESRGDYNIIFGGTKEPLTSMTIQDVFALQNRMVADGSESSAVGRYQFIRKTLKGLVEKLNIPKDAVFNEELQDRLAKELLDQRGLEKFRQGKISKEKFAENLSKEWASLPKDRTGQSYYKGVGSNKAHVSFEDLLSQLT